MHDVFNEVLDRLIAGGMDEYDAIALITQLFEQEAKSFIEFDELYKGGSFYINPDSFVS